MKKIIQACFALLFIMFCWSVYSLYFLKREYPLLNGYYLETAGKGFVADIYGPGKKILVKDVVELAVTDGWIYGYSRYETVRRMSFFRRMKYRLSVYKIKGKDDTGYALDMNSGELFFPMNDEENRALFGAKIKHYCNWKMIYVFEIMKGYGKMYWLNKDADFRCDRRDILADNVLKAEDNGKK